MRCELFLYRFECTDKHTVSALFKDTGINEYVQVCYCLELPYVNNCINISCIPDGVYEYKKENHPKFGKVLRILNVPHRSGILMHCGNVLKDTQGCILIGANFNYSQVTRSVYLSESQAVRLSVMDDLACNGYIHISSMR